MEKKGYALLSDPFQNKGTAFRADERVQFGLTGLLPPHVDTIAEQAQRIYQQMERKSSGIEKRRFLMDVFNRNRRLFYYVFRQHIAELMPIVYDPVIAESIEQYSEQFINPQETAYLSIDHPEEVETTLRQAAGRLQDGSQQEGPQRRHQAPHGQGGGHLRARHRGLVRRRLPRLDLLHAVQDDVRLPAV